MSYTESLLKAIATELEGHKQQVLAKATTDLSLRYRQGSDTFMASDADRLAYIAYRMPATFAALIYVLEELDRLVPEFQPNSLLDLGSGPGTALWAAAAIFQSLHNCTAIERDKDLISLAKKLSCYAPSSSIQTTEWIQKDLTEKLLEKKADLVIASYSIGELTEDLRRKLIEEAWNSTSKVLVIVEPGTPAGFSRIAWVRQWIIEAGGNLVAPCTHHNSCPMKNGDWCHFSQRLPRSQIHRQLKGAKLGHEDEKFSYLIAMKQPFQSVAQGRILRHPEKRTGHTILKLCTSEGLCDKTLSRRDGEAYKIARKSEWGDRFPSQVKAQN